MEAVDALATAEGWNDVIPKPVLDTVSFDGHQYAVPLNIHRLNTLFFNKQLFADNAIVEPTNLDELFSVAATFRARGITPIAVGAIEPWTLALLLFENLVVAHGGGSYYRDFFVGRGDAFAPEIVASLEDLRTLLSYSNANATQLTWSGAVELVRTGGAAMTIMGDWAKGYFLANQGTPDESFGAIPMPGTAGTFVFTTDTFGLPKGVRNRQGALDLLKVFGSREGQDTFNPIKGSIPARRDASTAAYDVMAQRTINDFRQAAADSTTLVPATAILAPPEFIDAIEKALARFAIDGNASAVLHTLDNWYDLLRPSPWQ
jgi:glucose/mannose transport system substrate-binding protein